MTSRASNKVLHAGGTKEEVGVPVRTAHRHGKLASGLADHSDLAKKECSPLHRQLLAELLSVARAGSASSGGTAGMINA